MRHAELWVAGAVGRRFGVKGPRAAETLKQLGLAVPARPNSWAPLRSHERDDSANVIARLGNTEFFIEERGDAPGVGALRAQLESSLSGAYPILREDFAAVIGGKRATDALAEVCNVDFAALAPAQKPAVMTLMTGVSVLVLPQQTDDGMVYRIWCDPSFGSYLWETLEEVVTTTTTGRAA